MRQQVRDPGWLATVVAGSMALVVAVWVVGARLLGPTELAVIRTEAWPWSGNGVGVEPVSADSPFEFGDVVVAMNGRPMTSWVEAAFRPPWEPPPAVLGPIVDFEIVRDGSTITVSAPMVGFRVERFAGAPIVLVVFGAGVLILAVVLVLQRMTSTALRLLFVGSAANVADIVAWEFGLQPSDFALANPMVVLFGIASLLNLVFWSSIVHILAVYPVPSEFVARHRAIVPALYLVPPAALIGLGSLAFAAGGTVIDGVDRLGPALAAVASAMVVLLIASTVAGYRRTTGSRRRDVRWIAATLLVAAIATLVLLTLPIVITGRPLISRSTLSFLALPVPIAIAVGVVRNRLFQVDLLARRRSRVMAAREEERRRLRRELHDGLAPTLAGVGIKLDLARQSVDDDPATARELIDEARADVRSTITEIRRMARELRPPSLDALGLEGAIREQATTLGAGAGPGSGSGAGSAAASGAGPVIHVDVPARLPALPAAVEVAAYRICIEALLNVVRHAAAGQCTVRLSLVEDELELEVVDDGRGVGAGAVGIGTRTMRERAAGVGGDVMITPVVGGGTRVLARLPIDPSLSGA